MTLVDALMHQVLINLILTAGIISCYSYMVPQESCYNMLPVHNKSTPQAILPPYKIVTEKTFYEPFEQIKISILSLNNMPFSGFLLQARLTNSGTVVGSWLLNSQMSPFIGILKCLDKNNSLVHAWPEFSSSAQQDGQQTSSNYFYNLTAIWIAPNATNWDIEFVATIVSKFDTFWTNVKSSRLAPVSRLLRNGGCSRALSGFKILGGLFAILFASFHLL